jgi:hypothetical protein
MADYAETYQSAPTRRVPPGVNDHAAGTSWRSKMPGQQTKTSTCWLSTSAFNMLDQDKLLQIILTC